MENTYVITLSHEDTSLLEEAKDTMFGFDKSTKSGVIRVNEEVVGFFELCNYGEGIYLDELEIIENNQNKGYGTLFIKELFNLYPDCKEIYGNSLEESCAFYASIGAEWESSCFNCPNIECQYNSNYDEELSDDDEECCDDYCDDYNENVFHIYRDNFFKLKK